MSTIKVKSKNNKLFKLIVPIGSIIILVALKISIPTGFALIIGLCVGSLGQKFGWWENKM